MQILIIFSESYVSICSFHVFVNKYLKLDWNISICNVNRENIFLLFWIFIFIR